MGGPAGIVSRWYAYGAVDPERSGCQVPFAPGVFDIARLFRPLVCCWAIAAVCSAPTPVLAACQSTDTVPAEDGGRSSLAAEIQLRSGVWRNLHHLLYAQAGDAGRSGPGRIPVLADDLAVAMSEEDEAVWRDALAAYAPLSQRDLLFDEELVRIGRMLSRTDGEHPPPADVPADIRRALVAARPAYERYYRERHERLNSDWSRMLQSLLRVHGDRAMGRLREIFGAEITGVDAIEVTVYGNWAGAYTSLAPIEIVIASGHPANSGDAALEIVLHEISHTMAGPLRRRLDEVIAELPGPQGADPVPRDLWHQILFYIAGEIVSELIPQYIAYADRNGLWDRVWSGRNRDLLERHIRPVLTGETTLDLVLEPMVADFAGDGRATQPR